MVRPFIEARHGGADCYPHPDLEGPLKETYGVVVFHEQIIDIVDIMTGCGRDEADRVRRGVCPTPSRRGGSGSGSHRTRRPRGTRRRDHRADLGDRRGLRVVRLLQGARGRLRRPDVPVGVAEGPSPGRLLRRVAHARPRMYPKRLLLADARRRGVPILSLDVNRLGGRPPYRTGAPNRMTPSAAGVSASLSPTCTASARPRRRGSRTDSRNGLPPTFGAGPAEQAARTAARAGRRAGRVRRQPA